MRARASDFVVMLGLAVVYTVAARLGLAFDAVSGFATLIWAPTGIALAAVLLLGYRVWPGIFIGATIANVLTGAPVVIAVGIGAGNTLEAIVGAYLLQRLPRFRPSLENATSAFGLIVLAALTSTLISASIGVTSLYAGHIISTPQIGETWRAWWVGDMVGALLIAPLILVWMTKPRARFTTHWKEQLALGVTIVAVSVTTFFSGLTGVPSLPTPLHQMDLLFVVLIWAAMRFGPRVAASAAFFMSAMAVAGTMQGYGPFALPELHHGLLSLQTFMALVAATVLLLSATIAERQIVHVELQHTRDEAAKANLAKSQFLAVMSHELRTPLNAIAGYSQLLETGAYGAMTDKQTDIVGRIRHSEEHLLSLVNEVLGYAQAEKGQVTVKTGKVEIAEAFDAVEPVIQPELRRKHCFFKRDLARPTLAVKADPETLQQILVSLLSNASKYTAEGGSVTLGAEPEGDKVRIWVSDTGVGIPESEIPKVFEPFFQTNGGNTRRATGVGLGLTIARDLVRRMAGDLTLTSKVGSGTTATIVLPAA
ncbi:MAG TPA: MASE1 domain-containing protein [Longimicrobiales bacterium]